MLRTPDPGFKPARDIRFSIYLALWIWLYDPVRHYFHPHCQTRRQNHSEGSGSESPQIVLRCWEIRFSDGQLKQEQTTGQHQYHFNFNAF